MYSAGPADPKIGCSGRNWKFPLDMHSIGVRYHRLKALCPPAPVRLRSAVEECTVLGVSDLVGTHEKALRDHSFSSRRNASKTPFAARDPYPRPLAAPPYEAGQLVRLRPFSRLLRARRRRGAFQTGSWTDCPWMSLSTFCLPRPRLSAGHSRDKPSEPCYLDKQRRTVDSRRDPRT
jgi:hypothetical protein